MPMTASASDVVDLAFAVHGDWLPRAHRRDLAEALRSALPWIAQDPAVRVHPLNLSAGAEARVLLSRRTRLTLRLPRALCDAARRLSGQALSVCGRTLRVGDASIRELLPFHTLFAHLVVGAQGLARDDLSFQRQIETELAARGLPCRAIFGRHLLLEEGALEGAPVMLDGLSPEAALRVMHEGLGPHRLMGCGVFVPHRSASAVGAAT